MLSRVVPGMAVTIARFSSSSALSSEDLPTFGRPIIATRAPLAQQHPGAALRDERGAARGEFFYPRGALVLRYEALALLGKIEVHLKRRGEVRQLVHENFYLGGQPSLERARGGLERLVAARLYNAEHGLRLRKVDAPVDEGAPRELAGLGKPRA